MPAAPCAPSASAAQREASPHSASSTCHSKPWRSPRAAFLRLNRLRASESVHNEVDGGESCSSLSVGAGQLREEPDSVQRSPAMHLLPRSATSILPSDTDAQTYSEDIAKEKQKSPLFGHVSLALCSHCEAVQRHRMRVSAVMQMLINSCKEIEDVIHQRFQGDTCICYPNYVVKGDLVYDLSRPIKFPDSLHSEFLEHLLRLVRPNNTEHETCLAYSRTVRYASGTSKALIPLTIDRASNRVVRLGYMRCYGANPFCGNTAAMPSDSAVPGRANASSDSGCESSSHKTVDRLGSDTQFSSDRYRIIELVVDYDPPSEYTPVPYRFRMAQERLRNMYARTPPSSDSAPAVFNPQRELSLSSVSSTVPSLHCTDKTLLTTGSDPQLSSGNNLVIENEISSETQEKANVATLHWLREGVEGRTANASRLDRLGDLSSETCVYINPESVALYCSPSRTTTYLRPTLSPNHPASGGSSLTPPVSVSAGYYTCRGRRPQMEDRAVVVMDLHELCGIPSVPGEAKAHFFAIYDGHGGSEVVDYVARYFHYEFVISKEYHQGDIEAAFRKTFKVVESKIAEKLQKLVQIKKRHRRWVHKLTKAAEGLPSSVNVSGELTNREETPEDEMRFEDASVDSNRAVCTSPFPPAAPCKPVLPLSDNGDNNVGPIGSSPLDSDHLSPEDRQLASNIKANFPLFETDAIQANICQLENEIAQMLNKVSIDSPSSSPNELADLGICDDVDEVSLTSGSTAAIVFIKGLSLYIANLGDSRCVLSRAGRVACLTEDHRLRSSVREIERVNSTPGTFTYDGYLCGQLAVSRAFGNVEHRSGEKLVGLSSLPDVVRITLRQDDDFLIIGCDGLFDSVTPMDAAVTVRNALQRTGDPSVASKELVEQALIYSEDNVSAIVVVFHPMPSVEASTVSAVRPPPPVASAPVLPLLESRGTPDDAIQGNDGTYQLAMLTSGMHHNSETDWQCLLDDEAGAHDNRNDGTKPCRRQKQGCCSLCRCTSVEPVSTYSDSPPNNVITSDTQSGTTPNPVPSYVKKRYRWRVVEAP